MMIAHMIVVHMIIERQGPEGDLTHCATPAKHGVGVLTIQDRDREEGEGATGDSERRARNRTELMTRRNIYINGKMLFKWGFHQI